jgi:CheY-like chemotaxis protein
VLACSEELAEMFGVSAGEAIGRTLLSILAADARDDAVAAIVSAAHACYRSRGLRDDGATFPMQVTSMPIRWERGEARLFTVRDLSPVALVVDDEAPVARMTSLLMRQAGYQTVTYTSPRQALADYQAGTAGIVVSDVMMPELDGVSLALRIRKLDPGVPVLFVTGFAGVDVPHDEATALVRKPFVARDLERALATLPERARAPLDR